jgi:hypothetical protein
MLPSDRQSLRPLALPFQPNARCEWCRVDLDPCGPQPQFAFLYPEWLFFVWGRSYLLLRPLTCAAFFLVAVMASVVPFRI